MLSIAFVHARMYAHITGRFKLLAALGTLVSLLIAMPFEMSVFVAQPQCFLAYITFESGTLIVGGKVFPIVSGDSKFFCTMCTF